MGASWGTFDCFTFHTPLSPQRLMINLLTLEKEWAEEQRSKRALKIYQVLRPIYTRSNSVMSSVAAA
jgi:DNA anti-recombination protein RmuC